jgi:hypothetical protein
MMRVSVPEALALVLGLVVDRLAGVMGDVGDPVGEARRGQCLRDARARAQILTRDPCLLVGHLRLPDRLELLALAWFVAAAAGGEWQD